MYRLLIVDDEEWIRNGLTSTIPWEKHDIMVVGAAQDAVEAMEMVQKYGPDVVVTDIVMPGSNGVNLCGWIQKEKPDTKVIMLSGHDHFSYAREAIRQGAFDYLLKPVEEDILIETVKEALKELHKEKELEEKAGFYTTSLEGAKQLFFMKLLDKKHQELILTGDESKYIKLDMKAHKSYGCAIWKFGESDEVKLGMIRDLIEKTIAQRLTSVEMDTELIGNQIICLYSGTEDLQEKIYECFLSLDTIMLLMPDCGCCVSRCSQGFSELKEKVCETVEVLENQFSMRGVTKSQDLKRRQKAGLKACGQCMQQFAEQFNPEDRDGTNILVEALIKNVLESAPEIGKNELGSILFQVMSDTAVRCQREGLSLEFPVTKNDEAVSWIFHMDSLDAAINGLKGFFQCLHDNIAFKDENTRNYLVKEALNYIGENFSRDISADEMSDYLHISKVYFSQLFSREVGCPFTKYLTGIRMEHAKKLLRETNERVYEIAEAAGYEDVKYFLKVFKKITGVSPQVYRERAI